LNFLVKDGVLENTVGDFGNNMWLRELVVKFISALQILTYRGVSWYIGNGCAQANATWLVTQCESILVSSRQHQ
jgi:hypothetical protein